MLAGKQRQSQGEQQAELTGLPEKAAFIGSPSSAFYILAWILFCLFGTECPRGSRQAALGEQDKVEADHLRVRFLAALAGLSS